MLPVPAVGGHPSEGGLREQQIGRQVRADDAVPDVERVILGATLARVDPGVVDEHIEAVEGAVESRS